MSTTQPCWSIEFSESFLFWAILLTYNIGIHICVYIFIKLAIFILFFIFNCNIFSALHAKHLEIWKKYFVKLMTRLLLSTIHEVMWYFWMFIVNPFSLLWSIFFSRKLCFLRSPCLMLIAEWINLDTSGKPTVQFFWKITSSSWTILSISLDELNSIDWLLKGWWWIFLK